MSIKQMVKVWETKFNNSSKKIVALTLADFASDGGECYPSISNIAAKCELSRSTVKRILSEFEAEGVIKKEVRVRPDGSHSSNTYWLDFDAVGGRFTMNPPRFTDEPGVGSPRTGGGFIAVNPLDPSDDPSSDPSVSGSSDSGGSAGELDSDFRNLWLFYRMNSKQPGNQAEAQRVFNAQIKGRYNVPDICRTIPYYLNDPTYKGKVFNLANFLANEAFMPYMSQRVRVLMQAEGEPDFWVTGTLDKAKSIFTADDGAEYILTEERLKQRFMAGQLEFLHEHPASKTA